jgi:hypothetical protein
VTDELSAVVVTQPERANGKIAAGGAIEIIGAAAADTDFTKFRRLVMMYCSDLVISAPILNIAMAAVVDPNDRIDDTCYQEKFLPVSIGFDANVWCSARNTY